MGSAEILERALEYVSRGEPVPAARIAKAMGLSRQRIHEVLRKQGIPAAPRKKPRPRCIYCGEETARPESRFHWDCYVAHLRLAWVDSVCARCGRVFRWKRPRRYCSWECRFPNRPRRR